MKQWKKTPSSSSNQTAEKLLVVLEALAFQSQPVRLIDFAKELNMNTSTLYRFLFALQNMGYVTQDEATGKYALNLKLCYLAEMIKRNQSIIALLHYAVIEASTLFQESAHLTQVEDQRIVYVDNAMTASQSLTIRQYIGKTAPMHCTGVGKLFLAEYSEDQLNSYVLHRELEALTPYTITTKDALCRELEDVRGRGYAFDNEECELGVRCIAVPIRDYTGHVAAGLSVSGPAARISGEVVQRKLPRLLEIARRASADLGFAAQADRSAGQT